MNILVTGSSGQLGSALIQHFAKSKIHNVSGVDRNPPPEIDVEPQVSFYTGDLIEKDISKKIVEDVDVIVHCAAQISVQRSILDPVEDASVNINCTMNLLDSLRRFGNAKQFIYISSAAVYGKTISLPIDETHPTIPISPYGLSKLTAENYVKQYNFYYGIPTTIIRPFNSYGSQVINPMAKNVIIKFLTNILSGKNLQIYGDGEQVRDFVHVEDVIQMVKKSIENKKAKGQIFNCGSGTRTTINELVDTIEIVFQELNFPYKINRVYSEPRDYEIINSFASISKAKKILGYRPRFTLRENLSGIIQRLLK